MPCIGVLNVGEDDILHVYLAGRRFCRSEKAEPHPEKKKLADATPAYTTYTVKRGDTLGAIARRYRTTTAQIMKLNKLKNANKLREGQRLRIPVRR